MMTITLEAKKGEHIVELLQKEKRLPKEEARRCKNIKHQKVQVKMIALSGVKLGCIDW